MTFPRQIIINSVKDIAAQSYNLTKDINMHVLNIVLNVYF